MTAPKKLKRVVIKEELVALTGDWLSALLLNQMLYWSERVKDHDEFLREEIDRGKRSAEELLRFGWIYKSAEELSKELMVGVSGDTVGRRMQVLVERGWLDRRNNPNHKWDKTYQYRVNVLKIQADLHKLNYTLENYPIPDPAAPIPQFAESENQNAESTSDSAEAIPEITTETTTEKKEGTPAFSEKLRGKDFLELAAVTAEMQRQEVEPNACLAELCEALFPRMAVPDDGGRWRYRWNDPLSKLRQLLGGMDGAEQFLRSLPVSEDDQERFTAEKATSPKGLLDIAAARVKLQQQATVEAASRAKTRAVYEARFQQSIAAMGGV